MRLRNILSIGFLLFSTTLLLRAQSEYHFTKAELEEFEILNLCHCNDYLLVRDHDYVAWKSEEGKKKSLKELEYRLLGRYLSNRLFLQYYQAKYDSTIFLKQGVSVYFGSELDFTRLDSLYYEPIVRYYVKEAGKTEVLPYFGLGDINFFFDCYHRVKEIHLEQELELFIRANQKFKN